MDKPRPKSAMHGHCNARSAITFFSRRALPPLDRYQIRYFVTEAHMCEQLLQGCYIKAERPEIELATFQSRAQSPNHYTTNKP